MPFFNGFFLTNVLDKWQLFGMIQTPARPCVFWARCIFGSNSKGPPHAEHLVLAGAGTGTASSHCRRPGDVRSVPEDRAGQGEADKSAAGKKI